MNSHAIAKRGYQKPTDFLRPARDMEYDAMARVTYRLREAAKAKSRKYPEFVEALHENVRLWVLLAGDVAAQDNQLPDELRARLIYLAQFTQLQTQRILKGDAKVSPLLEINVAILKGLRHKSEAT